MATALLSWMDQQAFVAGKRRPERNVEPGKPWEGSATALHNELLSVVNGLVATSSGFPKAPNKLSGELRRLAPALARAGVRVKLERSKHGSKITVEKVEDGGGEQPPATTQFPVLTPDPEAGRPRVPEPGDDVDDSDDGLRRYLSADYGVVAAPVLAAG